MRVATLTLLPLLGACIDLTDPNDETPTDTSPLVAHCEGQEVVEWDDPVIDSDDGVVTFSCTTRYSGDLSVLRGGHLILDPCAVLELGGGSRVFVSDGGILEAVGTADCPVTITSSSSVPMAGDWSYLDIANDADGATRFEHAIVEFGGGNSSQGVITGGGVFDLVDTTIRHAPGDGLSFGGGRVAALTRLTVEEVGGHPLVIDLDDVEMLDGITATVGIGEPSILVQSGVALDVDTTWDAESLPYELDGSYNVRADLTIDAGTTVWMAPGTRLTVESGRLDLLGTEAAPITVQSAAELPLPGDWNQFTFKSGADPSRWSWTTVRHGGGGGHGALQAEDDDRLTLEHVTFEDNLDCDVDRLPPNPVNVPATDTLYVDCP